jgi:hypothetical protein
MEEPMPRHFADLVLLSTSVLGCVLLAAPASARSNAAERAETRQLNLDAAQNARAHNSPAYRVRNAAANVPDNTPPAAAPTAPVKVAAVEPAASSAQPLTAVANPPDKIATANVFDRSGTLIGAVQKVELGAGGMPTDLNVALLGTAERIVTLDAARVQYDPSENRIVTDQSRAEILALPDAKPHGMQG